MSAEKTGGGTRRQLPVSTMIRAELTPGEHKRLKQLAIEKDLTTQSLVTLALMDSKHTRDIFRQP